MVMINGNTTDSIIPTASHAKIMGIFLSGLRVANIDKMASLHF